MDKTKFIINESQNVQVFLDKHKTDLRPDTDSLLATVKAIDSILKRYYPKDSPYLVDIEDFNSRIGMRNFTSLESYAISKDTENVIKMDIEKFIDSLLLEIRGLGLPSKECRSHVANSISITNIQKQEQEIELNFILQSIKNSIIFRINIKIKRP